MVNELDETMKDFPDFVTSIRIPFNMFEELRDKMKQKNVTSISEGIRTYCQLGLWVERIKHQVDDPTFIKKIDDLKQGNKLFEWTATLSEEQARAIRDAISLDLDARVKQEKFV